MPNKIENWSERHAAIRDILVSAPVHSQRELVTRLTRRGFAVTQSSVSRDLALMHAFKVDGRYVTAQTLNTPANESVPSETDPTLGDMQSITPAGPYLLVVRTPVGRAAPVAIALDQAQWPEIIGTIAGDDTVLIATNGRRSQSHLRARLTRLAAENHHV